MSPFL